MRSLPLLFLALAAALPAHAEKVAKLPAPTGYVADYANVMSADGKSQVEAVCREVHDKAKAQIFLVTINSLDGESIESFANDLFHTWKIGEKGTDRGILLLLAIKDHKRRIEVGYGFEGILPDAKAGRIGRDMVPALQTSNYDQAALAGVTEIANVIAEDAKVALDSTGPQPEHFDGEEPPPPVTGPPPSSELPGYKFVMAAFTFAFFGFFGFIVLMSVFRKRLGRTRGGGIGFVNASGSSSSGGSSSFSSDSESSSSDDSFSGGDGGDSGGGGASGDW